MKELEIGRNYWTVFGDNNGNQLTYLGGVKFRATNAKNGVTGIKESQDTYDKIKAHINRPNCEMGIPGGRF
jgi:hypothetical protein